MHMGSWGRYGQKAKLGQVIKIFENYTKEFVCSSIDSENVLAMCSFYQYIMKEKKTQILLLIKQARQPLKKITGLPLMKRVSKSGPQLTSIFLSP